MTNSPTVSILVANFNNGKYFKDCYESLLKQSFQDFEVIIVDDCSTDNSVEVIKQIVGDDYRCHIYQNEVNSGVGYTKKRCIDLANGMLCAFVDPDDAIVPNALEVMVKAHEDPKLGLVYSNFVFCDENLNKNKIHKTEQVKNDDPLFFNLGGIISHLAVFKKATYNVTDGLSSTLKKAIDQDLYIKLYEKAPVKYIDEDLYLYRIHSEGISTNDNVDKAHYWHWNAILDAARRRNVEVDEMFFTYFVRKNKYFKDLKKRNDVLSLLKKSRWLKLGHKLGLFKFYDLL